MGELLRNAAARGDSDQVVKLLADGVKATCDEGGRNALHIAAASGHADVVAALLLARWDVNAQDAAGYSPIQRAGAEGHLEVVKQLIKHGANVNIQDKVHGNTALHEASWKGYSKCVEALSQASKVNLQVKNFGGFAPLHLACQNGHNQSCRELLMANCNPNIQNNYGDTPLHTSARYGHAGVTRILISADCHMSDQNKNGDTALHITAAMGRRKLTRILLEAGCDPNRRNKQNEKARDIAIRKDLKEIVEIIDRTQPIRQKDRGLEDKENDKERKKANEKKRGKNESGSSKESASRSKEKKKHKNEHVHFEAAPETKWSPYGCHYYPDPKTFPKPKLDSLPHEPLKKGEQYYLDLAGNIRKGPVGVGYTCYCAPFFRHMEERLDRDKKELKDHIDAARVRLDKKVTNLEEKTRGQLDEITRSMALERFKCQQRHVHLEQWLIRGSIFRNSEKPRTKEPSSLEPAPLPKSRSLENILEEKDPPGYGTSRRSVEMLCDRFKSTADLIIPGDDLKNRSSSREGKESGKGSSEVVGMGTSDGEEDDGHRLCRSARQVSERIDRARDDADAVDVLLYDEMMKWRSYRRQSHEDGAGAEGSCVEEPEKKSVQEIVAKLQKQQTVQDLVARIQRKTGLVHRSAQKWNENKAKGKERDAGNQKYHEGAPDDSATVPAPTPNYENLRRWDEAPARDAVSHLPYRCRSGIYSAGSGEEYQRREVYEPEPRQSETVYSPPGDGYYREDVTNGAGIVDNRLYRTREYLVGDQTRHLSYSPTQNDSGYSTKPYGGSSTGPSPSLSGQECEVGSSEMKLPPVFPMRKRMEAPSSSLV